MFNMAITKHAILLAALLGLGVAGQDPSKMPKFAYPPNGSSKVFNLLDTVMVTYTAFYDTGTLYTFCEPGKGKLIYQQKAPGFTATVAVQLNFTSATPCWFNIRTGKDGIDGENSATFSLIGEERSGGRRVFGLDTDPDTGTTSSSTSATTSTSTSSSSASSSSLSSSSTTTSASGASSSVSSTTSVSSTNTTSGTTAENTSGSAGSGGGGAGGLSAGASAGIGIGAAVGVLGVAAVGFMFWWRRRGGRQGVVPAVEMEGGGSSGWPGYGEQQHHHHHHQQQQQQQYYPPYNTAPAVAKWQYGRELDAAMHTPAEIATSGRGGAGDTGRTHHEMSG